MNSIIGLNGDFSKVPVIPENLNKDQLHMLIPEGYEDMIRTEYRQETAILELHFVEEEKADKGFISISSSLYNPQSRGVSFPKFLIEQEFRKQKIDYLKPNNSNRFIFNQNELLWIVLQQRFESLREYSIKYSNLLNKDIKSVSDFKTNSPLKAYNAIQKEKNSYVILSLFNPKTGVLKKRNNSFCIGNILDSGDFKVSPSELSVLLSKLPLHFTAESNGEKSKFTLCPYDQPFPYRSIGLKFFSDERKRPFVKSIFPSKQNLPARLKTHVTADAVPIMNFKANSVFAQDYILDPETKTVSPKDECYVEALCVIHPFTETGKFLFGEIEASRKIVTTYVTVRESVLPVIHNLEEDTTFVVGNHFKAVRGVIDLGVDSLGNSITISDCHDATIVDVIPKGVWGVTKVTLEVNRYSGNARIDSNTGLKGVTKCKPNLGKITIPDLNKELKPDLVFGMNSFKAKGNSIELARSALAVKLGYYKPKHVTGLLNTLNEEEINLASNSLPEYSYIDEFGIERPVQIGIVYYRYTELCYVYQSFKPQKFSFECGRVLHSLEDKRLFNAIWKDYIDPERLSDVLELEKVHSDRQGIFQEDELPVYSPNFIKDKKIFAKEDLVDTVISNTEMASKLLDPNFNKGFYINYRSYNNGHLVRIPSADFLNRYVSVNDDKSFMYPRLLVLISRLIKDCLENTSHFSFPKVKKFDNTPVARYYATIKGLLYSSEDASVMMVQTLSRPEVMGFAGKQNVEPLLPDNVCLVMDDSIYKRAIKEALGDDGAVQELQYNFYGMHTRSPFYNRMLTEKTVSS